MSAAKKSELAVAVAAIRASEGVMKKKTGRWLPPNPPPPGASPYIDSRADVI